MSNFNSQCGSYIFNQQSLSLVTQFNTPLKPSLTTTTTFRPVFTFHNCFRKRPRCRTLYTSPPRSSSDVVLIATTEHRDGSLVFRFGDASEVVKNDDVVEDAESLSEQESNFLKVLDGDDEIQVIIKTVEADDEIRSADIDSDVDEKETNVISDLKEEEALSLQPDAKMNKYIKILEGTLDEIDSTSQLEGDEISSSTLSLLDDSPNKDKKESYEETLSKNSDSENEDPSVSVKLETEGDFDNVRIEIINTSDPEDLVASAMPVPMHNPDVELTAAVNEDIEEELKDNFINDSTLINKMLPPDTLNVELTVAASEVVVEGLKDVNIHEGVLKDEMRPSDTLDSELTVAASKDDEEELKISNITEGFLINEMLPPDTLDVELMVSATEDAEEELKDTSINEGILINETPPSDTLSDTLDVELTVAASVDDVEELKDTNINESTLIDEMLPSDTSDAKLTAAASEDVKEELIDTNIGELTLIDEMPSSDLLAIEPTLIEVSQIQLQVNVEEKTMDISSTESVYVKDQAIEDELQEVGTENKESSISNVLVSNIEKAEPDLDIKLQETKGQNSDEISLKANEETKDPSPSVKLEIMEGSQIEVMDVTQPYVQNEFHMVETGNTSEGDTEDLLPPTIHISGAKQTDAANEYMDIDEAILIDGLLPSDALGAEPTSEELTQLESSQGMLEATMEVSTTKSMDVEDQAVENELPEVSSDNWAENDIANMMPTEPTLAEEVSEPNSTPIELKSTMQLSDIEVHDAIGQNKDNAISLAINDNTRDSYINDAEQSSHQSELQPVQDGEVNHSMLEQSLENDSLENSILLTEGAIDPLLEAERNEDNMSNIELVEASADTALLLATETKVIREKIYITGNFLSSGATLLEHPYKALTGGDDACFVAGGKWLGVANGVNLWSFEGIEPGVFAQELMRTCEEIVLDNSSVPMTNPVELLCKGVKETNMSGSSNVLIANFDGQALHVANIGDTGFLIIRHGAIYKKSSPLLHEFHFALQVKDCDDPLLLVEEHTIELEEGDLVVSATDGLFDNLYELEIAMVVSKSFQSGMTPEEIANVLATRAQEVGRSVLVRSPFSDAARAAGYTGYAGGKPDNVAVIVSLVEKRSILGTG